MASPIAVVIAFGSKQKSVESPMLAHGCQATPATRQHLVDISLMTDVEEDFVGRRLEDAMKRYGEFDNP
jgi:hypothetical protein